MALELILVEPSDEASKDEKLQDLVDYLIFLKGSTELEESKCA